MPTARFPGHGSFASVEKCQYNGSTVAVEKMLNPAADGTIFAKEAKILHGIHCKNVVKFLGVCDQTMSIMMEYCEFSFSPFGREKSVHTLRQFLLYMDEEGLMTFFPRVCNVIAHDMINAVSYMHNLNMVHRDIKPANVLVLNMHYALKKGDCKEEFARCPIVCKLSDFGESRSQLCKTQAMLNNTRTKHLNRESPAFMALEVYVSKFMLHSANIDQLKAVDMWALLMTIFVSINPDQRYPYQLDLRNKSMSNPAADLEETLKEMLILHKLPSGSEE
eukprot:gene3948-4493_t